MKLPPLLDSIGNPLLALWSCCFFSFNGVPVAAPALQRFAPAVRNYVVSIPRFRDCAFCHVANSSDGCVWARDRHLGLLTGSICAEWIAAVAAFVLLDYAYWWWHWMNHMVPIFWRFHNVPSQRISIWT